MGMHDSFKRLLDAARHPAALRKATTAAALGRLLGESPQVMTNWKARGVSQGGALKAERLIGCSANWVLEGAGHAFQAPSFRRWLPRIAGH